MDNSNEGVSQQLRPNLALEALRRTASPLVPPTLTLRITEAERVARDLTPISAEAVLNRPRSNPRNRTPRRYESPLNPDEFRRDVVIQEEIPVSVSPGNSPIIPSEARRITIRPLTGRPVGTVATSRIHEERPATPKSRKQGPSHRKIRRWNNSHFLNLANEISQSSRRGHVAADVLIKAHNEAHLFKDIYNPNDHSSKEMTQFLHDEALQTLRDRFFEGEGPCPASTRRNPHVNNCHRPEETMTPAEMMQRMDARLRRVVIKAYTNSFPASQVLEKFEDYLLSVFATTTAEPPPPPTIPSSIDDVTEPWWKDLLVQAPSFQRRKGKTENGILTVHFYFPSSSSAGGFHRLLVHAVSQFHGYRVSSRLRALVEGGPKERLLTVFGKHDDSTHSPTHSRHRLVDYLKQQETND